jgi:hypothetical protein
MTEIVTGALFMFLLKAKSRNAYNNDRRDEVFAKNYYKMFKLDLPHPDAIDEVMRVLAPEQLELLKATLVGTLIEQKTLRQFRFMGKYYFVAVDATGTHSFNDKHCEHCLTRKSASGVMSYFHYVLEAKLVTSAGHAISIASEFIENIPGRDFEKQDCEQKAFVRLASKIKKYFPRLPICILADGLYPNSTVFEICRQNRWEFIINLKDGCLKTVQMEVALLNSVAIEKEVYRASKTENIRIKCKFLNQVEYNGHDYSWVSCTETKTRRSDNMVEAKTFVYITSIEQSLRTVIGLADSARLRWKIENEGFNAQKNLGYELEHKFSRVSYTALQNYYQMLQLAHMINQFVEKSSDVVELLKEHSKQTLINLWKDIGTFMHSIPHTDEQLKAFLSS